MRCDGKDKRRDRSDAAERSGNVPWILAQLPVDSKTNEIAVIPELLKLLDIRGSIVTIDAIGTQSAIMEQIHEQGGHFVLPGKKNQPEAYGEIHAFMDKVEEEAGKKTGFRILSCGSILKNMKKSARWKRTGVETSIGIVKYITIYQT